MRRKLVTVLVGLLIAGLLLPIALGGHKRGPDERAAVTAAEQWLQLVDQKRYGESWSEAATYFQQAVPKEKWTEQLEAVRSPLGAVTSRTLVGAKRVKALPGAPDGDYVVIRFRTSFENKKSATETVTPMMDGDRGWRVSGYYIK